MKRTRRNPRPQGRQRRPAEKREPLSDDAPLPAVPTDPVDAMSADSFPASDPPGFIVMRLGRRNGGRDPIP